MPKPPTLESPEAFAVTVAGSFHRWSLRSDGLIVVAEHVAARDAQVRAEMSATVADLRDRLGLLASFACQSCGCAPIDIVTCYGNLENDEYCLDCDSPGGGYPPSEEDAAKAVSRFCRALVGRRLVP